MYLTAQGFKSFEVFKADETFIFKMADILIEKLKFTGNLTPLNGLDGCYMDFYKDRIRITVGWDNWSGCFAMARCQDGDSYIIKLAEHLEEYLKTM